MPERLHNGGFTRRLSAAPGCAASVVLLLLLGHSVASGLSLQASVDKSKVTVGDPITYTLTIRHREDERIIRAPETEELFGPFHVQSFRRIPAGKDKKGGQEDRIEYVITAYETGSQQIPPVSVVFTTASGDTTQVQTEPIGIEVASVLPELGVDDPQSEDVEIRDIKPPAEIRGSGLGWLVWAGVVALVALAMGSYVWYKHRLKLWELRARDLEHPVDELAELEKIAVLGLIEKGEYKRLHILLSEALRRFIGRRWGIDAMERTTFEIAYLLRDQGVSEDHVALIRDFLDDCDLVKFAKYVPPKEVMGGMVERAREIVRSTRKFVVVAGEGEGTELAGEGPQVPQEPAAETSDARRGGAA